MKSYQSQFTYAYPIVDGIGDVSFMEHSDGVVSCAIKWSGIDYEGSHSDSDLAGDFNNLCRFYRAASQHTDLYIENHMFRSRDVYHCEKYYEYGVSRFLPDRNPDLATRVRQDLATHYANYSRHTDIYLVLCIKPKFGLFSGVGVKAVHSRKKRLAVIANELVSYLPGSSKLLSIDQYTSLMLRSNNPSLVSNGRDSIPYNYRFDARNRLIKPVINYRENCLATPERNYHRVITLLDYPDASPSWQVPLSRCNSDSIHVVQVCRPLNMQAVNLNSAAVTRQSSEAAGLLGGEAVAGKLQDHSSFRDFIQDHNLSVHANCFVIVLSASSADDVNSHHRDLCKVLRNESGVALVTDDLELELLYHHVSTPGMGYTSPYMRPDHDIQVANMTPCFSQSHGDETHPEVGFISSAGNFVGMRFEQDMLHHGLTAAKTGSGKSVTAAAQIAQMYPLGFNFYVIEVGRSFEYLIKAFGGEYHVLDADNTVISPFSSYAEMDRIMDAAARSNSKLSDDDSLESDSIPATAVSTLRRCLLPIVLSTSDPETIDGLVHYESILDDVIKVLYSSDIRDDSLEGPTLQTLLEISEEFLGFLKEEDDHRVQYLSAMVNNLSSFLSTSEGAVFKKADTLKFESGLIGLDFGELIRGNAESLSKYLLLFCVTRLQQLAFTQPEQTFMFFDEDHEYTAIDRKLMDTVKRQVTKRGRKSSAFINPISQSVEDIAYNEDGSVNTKLINQMSNYLLMFYGTDHGDLASVFKLPDRAKNIWHSYEDPLKPGNSFDFRQALYVRSGEFWDLFLTWPKILSDITNTKPSAMLKKSELLEELDGDAVHALERFAREYEG